MRELVTFRVGESRYALPADIVTECVEVGRITESVPAADGGRLGLACVRDRWVPVLELVKAIPGAPQMDPDADNTVLLVLGRDRGRLALRVEAFDGVMGGLSGSVAHERRVDDLIELNGELVHYVDPAALLASGALLESEGGSMEEKSTAVEPLQVVAFRVGGEEFGLEVMKVKRVLKVPELRIVPKAPDFVEGVVSIAGSIVPVIDMRKRFSVSEAAGSGHLLVVEAGDSQVGLVVDEVPGVTNIAEDAVSPAPDFFKGLAGRYLGGIAEDQGRLIILLNIEEVLSSKERIALKKMLKQEEGEASKGDSAGKAKRKKGGGRRKKTAKK